MSLVLPRSVGVESDDEMLCLWLEEDDAGFDVEALKGELPNGIEISSVEISRAKNVPEPSSARYEIKVKRVDEGIKGRIEKLLASDRIIVERRSGEDSKVKTVDVRPFLESISVEAGDVVVDCKISQAGTIRVDEILGLLRLGVEDLAEPVKRTGVRWSGITADGY
jgi:radical SAM-linked protein